MTAVVLATLVAALVATLVWPRYGLLDRARRARELARRSRGEDALKHLLKSEASGRPATLESIAGILEISTAAAAHLVAELEADGLIRLDAGTVGLGPQGRAVALHLVRAHRLWESYLAEQTGVAEHEWHERADRQEHLLTPGGVDALAARLGHPMRDPHGDVIPAPGGGLEGEHAPTLNSAEPGRAYEIVHIEDEPASVYQQLSAGGLRPGMKAFVIEKDASGVRFWADGDEHRLAPLVAENVTVAAFAGHTPDDLAARRYLWDLAAGERARVVEISPACRGPERRRLLDLGFVPGTLVEVELVSPAGDPTAYRLRGSVVALRREQARFIRIATIETVDAVAEEALT
jgi:DtxR family Mn-dependent transcriptional regulator